MRGLDFNIKRLVKVAMLTIQLLNWARKESSLTQAEQDAIEAHGLFTLSSLSSFK